MQHHVGIKSQDRRLVIGRHDPGVGAPRQGSGVDPHFVRRVDEDPDKFELGVIDDLGELNPSPPDQ